MYKLLYAPVDEYAGMDEAAYDWAVWGKYNSLIEAAQDIYECIDADFENNDEYAYRIVKAEP